MQILYVEDDSYLAHTVELALRERGYFCHIANLGEQAISLARRNRYDIIVLDIMLPDIDGYEVIERLRDAGVETPYLIQSGLLDRASMADGDSFGVEEFLIKPFTVDELVERMRNATDQAKQSAAAMPKYQPLARAAIIPGDGADRRKHRRFTTLKAGEVVSGDGDEGAACVILNMSHGGAAIRLVQQHTDIPERFSMRLQCGDLYDCRVCWRHGDKVGVGFTTPNTKPRH